MATAIVDPEPEIGAPLGPDFDAAIDEVAGHLNAQHARLVDLTMWMLADDSLWAGEGVHSIELFLAWRTGLAPQRARQIVAIARRADELPESIEAFRRGELAIDQMAAVAQRAPWWTDGEICALAKMLTVSQLRRTLAQYPFPDIARPGDHTTDMNNATDPGAADGAATADDGASGNVIDGGAVTAPSVAPGSTGADPASDNDGSPDGSMTAGWMWWGVGDDGRFRLNVECDQLAGMTIDAALREARDHLVQNGHRNVCDTDAFVEMAQRSLDTIADPQRRERFRINIHLRTPAATGTATATGTGTGTGCTDDHGTAMPDAIRRYITCDGLMSPVFIHNTIPISVGRTQRTIPLRTRRIVLLRDQGCRVPGCTITHHIEVHHIVHWEDDGPTDTWNLIALCPRHHRMHHRGELGITGNANDPDGITFTNRHGRVIGTTGARPKPPGAPPPPPAEAYQHPLGERLDTRWLYFNPPPEHRTTAWANHPHNPLRAS
jgi:hypothetical protein